MAAPPNRHMRKKTSLRKMEYTKAITTPRNRKPAHGKRGKIGKFMVEKGVDQKMDIDRPDDSGKQEESQAEKGRKQDDPIFFFQYHRQEQKQHQAGADALQDVGAKEIARFSRPHQIDGLAQRNRRQVDPVPHADDEQDAAQTREKSAVQKDGLLPLVVKGEEGTEARREQNPGATTPCNSS